ncbi:MAG: PQQ-like beta-propeller repeat protein [Bdellovibrionaceae bacterium]|nr:PQQ-like beta-propeller repeat protein [Pseudobdellovibrionaceae bacterium]
MEAVWTITPLNVGIHSAVKSSPAVDETGIYVGSDTGWFLKFDFSGREIWRFFSAHASFGFHSTATLDRERVYVGSYNGTFYALDKKDGRVAWHVRLGDAIGASSFMHDGFLYVAVETWRPDGFLAKIDARDGQVIWRSPWAGEHIHASPALSENAGLVFSGSNTRSVFAVDSRDGTPVWTAEAGGETKLSMTVHQDTVWTGSFDGTLRSFDARSGAGKLQIPLGGQLNSGLAVSSDGNWGVITSFEALSWIDLRDGRILRQYRYPGGRNRLIQYSPIMVVAPHADLVLGLCDLKVLCLFDDHARVIAKTGLPETFSGEPKIHGDDVYLSMDGKGGLSRIRFIFD